jgi:hypothetical protein
MLLPCAPRYPDRLKDGPSEEDDDDALLPA